MSESIFDCLFLLLVSVLFTNIRYPSASSDYKSLAYWMVETSKIALISSILKVMQVVPRIRCNVFQSIWMWCFTRAGWVQSHNAY
jgi:hypothetical protein